MNIHPYSCIFIDSQMHEMYTVEAVVVGMMPAMSLTAHATVTGYAIYVGETRITSANASDVFGDGKVSFDRNNLILSLKDFSYTGVGHNGCGIYANYDELTIQIEGDITSECTAERSHGIKNTGKLPIKGSGTLKASGEYGGITAHGNVTIESSTVKATATDTVEEDSRTGLFCEGDFTMTDSTVTATAAYEGNDWYNSGIWCNTATITGGKLIAAGASGAIYNHWQDVIVKNNLTGTGWTDMAGTTGKKVIPVSTEGQTLDGYKKIQFPEWTDPVTPAKSKAKVTTAPKAKSLTYNGKAQALVTAGKASGGTMQYAIGNASKVTGKYGAAIPTGTKAGT